MNNRSSRGTKRITLPNGGTMVLPCRVTSDTVEYTTDQWQFIKACADAQTSKGSNLTPAEVLRVAKAIGWKKPFAPQEVSERAAAL